MAFGNFEEKVIDHQKAQLTINSLNESMNWALQSGEWHVAVINAIKRFCFSCMRPIDPDCDLCNGHPRKENELNTLLNT